ncbi:uncharacterized protein LOC110983463 isoform X3 [Acanthaster planci]|uniref:Uncharacterized protein LOC110983463 isoform X3 n=1 Tax=Acanthaster planci TaxID=133434 RepID=A0A8B7Z519_ACAPL|nr:uncharacterized protein LOC110983463 isoform X3 [Acanthaster planci]XP_022098436.1 uncharacterized protein LOC110983463 isoform X3 [Acanthaster planci]
MGCCFSATPILGQPQPRSPKMPQRTSRDSDERQGHITPDQAHSSYLKNKLKAKEERESILPSAKDRKNDRPTPTRHGAITDPREAAHIRGKKLGEAEVATAKMASGALRWKQTASKLQTK